MTGRVRTDADPNPELAAQVQGLRGAMIGALPADDSRFGVVAADTAPRVVVADRRTGRSTTVALCDARGVLDALRDLFPDNG